MSIGILTGLFLAYIICAVDSESKRSEEVKKIAKISEDRQEALIKAIIKKAEKNLTPWEVRDVERLLASVKYKKRYADITEEEIENL